MEKPYAVAFCYHLERDGSNHCLLHILRYFSAQFRITLITPSNGPLYTVFLSFGIHIEILPFQKNHVRNFDHLLKSVELAFINTLVCADAMIEIGKRNIPHLWMIHETWQLQNFSHFRKKIWGWALPTKKVLLSAFHFAKHIIYPAHISDHHYASLTKQVSTHVIYNGLPQDWFNIAYFHDKRDEYRRRLGYTSHDIVFLHMGTLCVRKGQVQSLEAFHYLKSIYPQLSIKLLFVGSRKINADEIEYENQLQQKIITYHLSDHVNILPTTEDVKSFYAVADILLLPSLSEVLPLVIVEAMAFRIPVVASNINGIPEVIVHEKNGFLISTHNHIELAHYMYRLAINPDERKRISEQGYQMAVSQFHIDNMLRNYQSVITHHILQSGK